MKKALVVYHGPSCLDGLAAAAVARSTLGDDAEYIVGRYQMDNSHIDFVDRVVYLLDFSYPVEEMERICQVAEQVILLDHHKSALDAILPLAPKYICKLNTTWARTDASGAMIAWHYFRNGRSPTAINWIQDRDLWQFKYPATKGFCAYLYATEPTIQQMQKIIAMNLDACNEMAKKGQLLVNAQTKECLSTIKFARRNVSMMGYFVPLVNCTPALTSEIGNILAKDNAFSVMYFDSKNHRNFSLRSSKEFTDWVDVSKIALNYGGGGHLHAAGFKVTRGHPLAQI